MNVQEETNSLKTREAKLSIRDKYTLASRIIDINNNRPGLIVLQADVMGRNKVNCKLLCESRTWR